MSRGSLLILLCIALPAGLWGRPALADGFDAATAASVWGAALSYIAPRSLQAETIPQMTIWGLNGLTALDPNLQATLAGGEIRLYGPTQLLIALPAPAADDATGWARAAAAAAAAAYAASPALRQAGTQGLIGSFFDELFDHFDPYSRYEPPGQAAQDQLMITGLAGTGLTLGRQGNAVVITDVNAASPAAEAGLAAGFRVLAIDRRAVFPGDLAALNNAMNGLTGTSTTLRVQDPTGPAAGQPAAAPQDVTLTRAAIPPQTVFAFTLPEATIMGLKISAFDRGTSAQFSAALVAAMTAAPRATPDGSGLIIDLRGDRGGILRQAVLVADSLLTSGRIAAASGRDPDADQQFVAEGADLTGGLKLVVLVDGQTASAAEILAAALADNGRAVVIGSETLGKGLVQTLTALPDGGELYVTWSRVLAPRGWPLQTLGLMPQICTSLGEPAVTQQLDALAGGRNLLAPMLEQARAARAPVPIAQALDIRDACPAAIGGDLDLTAATAVLANPRLYDAALLEQ